MFFYRNGEKMKIRRMVGLVGTALSAGVGIAVVDAAPALAVSCPATKDVYIGGGESHYTVTCSGSKVYVNGRVKDTSADGACIQVKALINGTWYYSNKACPSGEVEYFSWSGTGTSASVYTYKV